MPRYLPFVLVAAVGLAVLIAGTLLYRAQSPPVLTIPPKRVAAAGKASAPELVRGDPDAPVTLEEFGDLQCPPCAALCEPINRIEEGSKGRVRLIYHHFPFASHAFARDAALAAEAAGAQGRFWPMHDLLYREQSDWSKAAQPRLLFASYAGTLGLDVGRFQRDMRSKAIGALVDADEKLGAKLGVSMTPTIFLDGVAVPQASLRPDRLGNLVNEAVKAKNPS